MTLKATHKSLSAMFPMGSRSSLSSSRASTSRASLKPLSPVPSEGIRDAASPKLRSLSPDPLVARKRLVLVPHADEEKPSAPASHDVQDAVDGVQGRVDTAP